MSEPTAGPPDTDTGAPVDRRSSRRGVLQGIGVTAVAGAAGFVGFRTYGPQPNQPAARTPADSSSGGTLAALSEIPADGGLVLEDVKLVVTRSGDTVKCFSAVCTHQGCLVGGVGDGVISCPCHGSAFDASTGAVVNGPAQSPLTEVPVVVYGDSVVKA